MFQGAGMDKRILWGCIAVLGVMMAFSLLAFAFDDALNQATSTPLGGLPLFDLAGVLVATALGGALAGARFTRVALALMVVVWSLSLAVMAGAPQTSFNDALRYNTLAVVMSLALAWLGAHLGARYGQS